MSVIPAGPHKAQSPSETYKFALSLTSDTCDPFVRALQDANPDLFRPNGTNVRLETNPVVDDRNIESSLVDDVTSDEELEHVLEKHLGYPGDTFIYLFQDHSWAPFNLSEKALRHIIAATCPRPEFLGLFKGFGHPDGGYNSDFSGGYSSHVEMARNASSHAGGASGLRAWRYDFAYTLRHVALTGRPECPWSERRTGVYHMFDSSKSIWIILQPTPAALGLPQTAQNALRINQSQFSELPIMLHVELFKAALPAWKTYLKYLETLVQKNSRKARLPAQNVDVSVAFESAQNMQYYSDLLHNAISQLRSNKEILIGLQSRVSTLNELEDPSIQCWLTTCLSQFGMNLSWAEDMLDRTKQVSNLMSLWLYSMHSEALSINTTNMTEIAKATKADQDVILNVTKAAKNDSGIMKLVAIISVAYLPSSLVTALFSTGFVTAGLNRNPENDYSHDVARNQALIYTVVSLSLSILTGLASYIWHKRGVFWSAGSGQSGRI